MKTSEALYAAADYIRKHGWQKYDMGCDGGPRCIVGALYSATGMDPRANYRDTLPGYSAISRMLDDDWLGDYNDTYFESADDAIAVLEIAADIATAEGV